jgi:nucleoside-diphosphate-sugar epimerase
MRVKGQPKMHRVVMTGATGFIGRHVLAAAIEQNWRVTVLGRKNPTQHVAEFVAWDLDGTRRPSQGLTCDVLIHMAADMRPEWEAISEAEEVARARELFDFVCKTPLIVFISSQASNRHAPTRYGRVKYQIEQLVTARGGIVIRPGLVYSGARHSGLHSRVRHLLARLPIIPDFRPAPIIQPIHVADLSQAIVRAATGEVPRRIYHLGEPSGLRFTEYLRLTARLQLARWRPSLPVPNLLVTAAFPLLKILFIGDIDLAKLKSLMSATQMDTAADLEALSVKLRPLRQGLRPNGRFEVRELITEGWALMSYLLGRPPHRNLVKRYVRSIRKRANHEPLNIRMLLVAYPKLLRLCEGKSVLAARRDLALELRLDIATRIIESSVIGAELFLRTQPFSKIRALGAVISICIVDVLWQLLACGISMRIRDDV